MPFTVHGLSPEPFLPLYGLSDAELIERRARRVIADGAGYPERIELRDAEPGTTLLLVNYEHQPADTPFQFSADGMLVDADACEGKDAENMIERLLGNERIDYLHAHAARPGCYLARIDRL